MVQKKAEYIKSLTGTGDILYDGKFQLAFMGRSNVGKSSLINSLLGRKLARTSSTPGKTIKMDFFLIEGKYYFVDFPGYGYARRSKEKLEKIRKMILWYVMYSEVKNRMVVLITDIKVGLTDFDRQMIDVLNQSQVPFVLIANKSDKMKGQIRDKQLEKIAEESGCEPIAYSSYHPEGKEILWREIFSKVMAS